MKQTISLAIIMMLAISGVFAKNKEARVSPHTTVNGTNVSVTYGQPSKKGRVIFGAKDLNPLVPYGDVWRTGADEATQVTFTKDVYIGGNAQKLAAGTYTLFTKPAPREWVFIFNSKLKQWGAFDYEQNKSKDVLTTSGVVKHLDHSVETFTITPQADGLLLEWDQVSVLLPVKFSDK